MDLSSFRETGMSRRGFLNLGCAAAVTLALAGPGLAFAQSAGAGAGAPYVMPPLSYANDALEPYISAKTLEFHYGKHAKGYFDNTNKMVEGKPQASLSLEKLVVEAAKDTASPGLFNQAAQAWNHAFYWNCMKKNGGGQPTGKVLTAINSSFGSLDNFKKEFSEAATTQFGSGWAWLTMDAGKLKVVKTPNAMNPMVDGQKPLLVVDVWEHAYYLDYQNRRADYVKAFLDHLVNWEFVESNLI